MLPPARPLISPASGGLLGLGCEGDLRFSARLVRLGTSLSRFVFLGRCPSGVGEAMTAAARWNKSLQLLHRLGDAYSGIGEGLVRVGSHGAGCLVDARFLLVLRDSKVGVGFQRFQQGTSAKLWRGMAAGLLVTWWVDLDLFFAVRRRGGRIHGQRSRSLGCVPGRCAFFVLFYCGSIQSFAAVEFLLTSVFTSSHSVCKRSAGASCNFLFCQGLLCKCMWTAVSSLWF